MDAITQFQESIIRHGRGPGPLSQAVKSIGSVSTANTNVAVIFFVPMEFQRGPFWETGNVMCSGGDSNINLMKNYRRTI